MRRAAKIEDTPESSAELTETGSEEDFDQAVNSTLRRMVELLSVDRGYLFRFSEGMARITNTHEWCAEGVEPQMQRVQGRRTDDLTWWKDRIREQRPFQIPDVTELPPEAEAQRRRFSSRETRSLLCLPTVGADGHLSGFLGFEAVGRAHHWSPEQVTVLHLVADTIGSAVERRRAAETLGKRREKYGALFDQAPQGMYVHDLDGRILDVNEMACQQSGYDRAELLQMRMRDLRPGGADTGSPAEPEIHRPWRTWRPGERTAFEAEHQRKDGAIIPVEVSAGVIEYDRSHLVLAMVQEITERRAAEQEVRDSEERYRRIVKAIPDLILQVSGSGEIVDCESGAVSPPIQLPDEIDGVTIDEVLPTKTGRGMLTAIGETLVSGEHRSEQYRIVTGRGERVIEARMAPLTADRVLVVVRDIDEKARVEAMNSDFISRTSHGLRSPITTALLMIDLIEEGGPEEETEQAWRILRAELERQRKLVERLLTIGQLDSKQFCMTPQPTDLGPVLHDALAGIQGQAHMKRITLCHEIAPELQPVVGDVDALQQVFGDLLTNAVKYTPAEGEITVRALQQGDGVCVQIADTGMGIPPEDLERVFERFTRGRRAERAGIPGSGLGLYIAKAITEELGGSISVESECDEGTTFEVWLPTAGGC